MPGKMPKVGEVWKTHDGCFEATVCDVITHGSDGTMRIAIVYNMSGKTNWRELQEFRQAFSSTALSHEGIQAEASWLLEYAKEVPDEGDFGPRLCRLLRQLVQGNF